MTDPTNPEHNRDLHEPRARRYAEAIATAAAADQRVAELTEQLSDHEWHRTRAEEQAYALLDRIDLGLTQLIPATSDAPGPEVEGLIDQADGAAWVRATRHDGTPDGDFWVRADAAGNTMRYEWPLADGGPYIPLPSDWSLARMNREARRRNETEDQLHRSLYSKDGYRVPGDGYARPDLAEAIPRVIAAKDQRISELNARVHALRQGIHNQIREPYDQLEVEHVPGEVTLVQVVTVEALQGLLQRDEA